MRGVKSFAMVFCVCSSLILQQFGMLNCPQATSKDGKEGGIELIQPPPGSQPGERVYFEGPEFESEWITLRAIAA